MSAGKRRRTGVDSFLDVVAVEDANDRDEGESEVEERFEFSDDDDENDSTSARTSVSSEAHEDQQAFVNALCDDLIVRYVRDPHTNEGPATLQQSSRSTPLFLPSPSEPSPLPTYPSVSMQPSGCIAQIPLVERMDPWERIHTTQKNAESANIPPVHRDDLRKQKKRYSRAVSTRLREYVGHLEWVTICSGTYRGDVGLAIGLYKDDKDDEEEREREEILQNKLKYDQSKKRRLEQERDIEQMRAEQWELVHELAFGMKPQVELDDSSYKRDVFRILLVPRLPFSNREQSEQQQEDRDIIRPFTHGTDGSSSHRNPPRLFNPKEYDDVASIKDQGIDRYFFEDSLLTLEGLLLANFHRKDLLLATSIPVKLENLFRQANHPILETCPLPHPSTWSFDDGEDVIWTDSGDPQRGMNMTFKHLKVGRRRNSPQMALVNVKVDAKRVSKPAATPLVSPHPANETSEERVLRERWEEEARRLREVGNKGEHVAQVRNLLKPHKKDDWVIVMTGKDCGKSGRILARYENVITVVIPEYHTFATCHVNAAKRIPTPVKGDARLDVFGTRRELVPVPWVGIEVRVTRGPQSGCIGRVEMVERAEGKFGRRLLVGLWVDVLKRLVLADHDHMLTTDMAQRLRDVQPLSEAQMLVYGLSPSMLTSREPWLATRVLITKGQFKGQLGKVRGVDVTFETNNLQRDRHVLGKTLANRKGIRLRIELETHMAVNTGLVTLDYSHIRDLKSGRLLNQAYPVRSGTFYDFRSDLKELPGIAEELDHLEPAPRPEALGTPQWSREEVEAIHFDTTLETHWDPYSSSPRPIGTFGPDPAWTPASPPSNPIELPIPAPDDEPLSPSEQSAAERLENFCLEAFREAEEEEARLALSVPQHWILHANLVGLKVQAAVENEDTYLSIVKDSRGPVAMKNEREMIRDLDTIQRARDPIKAGTERNLMVVIGGESEHIGKLVRRTSTFYLGSRSDDNLRIIVAVIERDSSSAEELVTPERLELDPKTMLARVHESDRNRAKFNKALKAERDALQAQNKRMVPIRALP
ncbi:hypothetical protein PQX77_015496 [Marasmius sp. AFHP31]|nr:hypothetical protein PQX77_015496 [Marasmius sp. AFHP31]